MAIKYGIECFPVKLSLETSEDAYHHFFNPKYRISSLEVETLLNFRSQFSADLLQEYASREDSYTLCIDFDKFSLVYLRSDRKKPIRFNYEYLRILRIRGVKVLREAIEEDPLGGWNTKPNSMYALSILGKRLNFLCNPEKSHNIRFKSAFVHCATGNGLVDEQSEPLLDNLEGQFEVLTGPRHLRICIYNSGRKFEIVSPLKLEYGVVELDEPIHQKPNPIRAVNFWRSDIPVFGIEPVTIDNYLFMEGEESIEEMARICRAVGRPSASRAIQRARDVPSSKRITTKHILSSLNACFVLYKRRRRTRLVSREDYEKFRVTNCFKCFPWESIPVLGSWLSRNIRYGLPGREHNPDLEGILELIEGSQAKQTWTLLFHASLAMARKRPAGFENSRCLHPRERELSSATLLQCPEIRTLMNAGFISDNGLILDDLFTQGLVVQTDECAASIFVREEREKYKLDKIQKRAIDFETQLNRILCGTGIISDFSVLTPVTKWDAPYSFHGNSREFVNTLLINYPNIFKTKGNSTRNLTEIEMDRTCVLIQDLQCDLSWMRSLIDFNFVPKNLSVKDNESEMHTKARQYKFRNNRTKSPISNSTMKGISSTSGL